jgi:hypothetical protein
MVVVLFNSSGNSGFVLKNGCFRVFKVFGCCPKSIKRISSEASGCLFLAAFRMVFAFVAYPLAKNEFQLPFIAIGAFSPGFLNRFFHLGSPTPDRRASAITDNRIENEKGTIIP